MLPTSPALSTVQVLASTNFAPIGFVFPTDGRDRTAVSLNLQYAWKEVRRWHRSFSVLCDEAPDDDLLHVFHLLFSSLFILLCEGTSDTIDKSIRAALQPLREWAGTVMRTPQEYSDFMSNVRASMVVLYRAIQSIGVEQLSSKQAAEINTSMDEVAIFLQLKKPAPMAPAQQQKVEKNEQCILPAASKKPGLLTKLRKMLSRKR